ncbi:Gfo/Idh/MocA family protein [Paenibacillus sp. IITD108]|uniref:Gfo/Idh/MocA family protein n=1 Tax=Paenibacillus sp. IITD108 TaxID=3116649 RepID=UPI002F42586C
MDKKDGMNYAPKGNKSSVVAEGEFKFGVIGLDHGHIYGMCNGLLEAGGELVIVYDPDSDKLASFQQKFPQAAIAASESEVLEHNELQLIASAAIPSERCGIGLRALEHDKHYFADKPSFTTLEQIELAERKTAATGLKWGVYFSERLHVEGAVFAGQLIEDGAIGRVVNVIGTGPHRIHAPSRPDWFFEHDRYGGILCDIGSHQIEQFLHYAGAKDARVLHSKVANYHFKQYKGFEDFGDATLVADNGATFYFRVDWLTPEGLGTWGDGRVLIMGTNGYIEVRKYIDIAARSTGNHVYLVNGQGEQHFEVTGKVGYPFFGAFIKDCIDGTDNAMTQTHIFTASRLCIEAQLQAIVVES